MNRDLLDQLDYALIVAEMECIKEALKLKPGEIMFDGYRALVTQIRCQRLEAYSGIPTPMPRATRVIPHRKDWPTR